MSHLQSELAETKVGLLMVKAEEAAEKDATDVLIRTILSIVSVGEMTETRHSAVEALTAIKASRATREDWKKDTANTPPREKRRGSPASTPTRGSPRAASLRSDWAPGGGVSSPSNGRGGGGPPVRYSTGTHNIDVQITEERAQPSGEVEYALDVFEIGRDFITRSWHTYAECSDLLAMLRGVASDDGWVSGSEGLLPSVATPQLSRQDRWILADAAVLLCAGRRRRWASRAGSSSAASSASWCTRARRRVVSCWTTSSVRAAGCASLLRLLSCRCGVGVRAGFSSPTRSQSSPNRDGGWN